jgi:hypothetical protein
MARDKLPTPRNPNVPTRPTSAAIITTAWGQAIHDAVFGKTVILDVRDGWSKVDVPANTPDQTFLLHNGQAVQPISGLIGSVIGIWARCSALPTAGVIRIMVRVGTTWAPDFLTFQAGAQSAQSIRLATPLVVNTTTAIQMGYGADAGLLPNNSVDINCGLILGYDYRASP